MTLAIFNSYDLAAAAQDLAWRYVQQSQGARGSAWADIVTDGTQFGFLYDSSISPAFDVQPTLLEVTDASLWTPFSSAPTAP